MEKKKGIILTCVMGVLLFGLAVLHLIFPDEEASRAERRKLAQAPEISVDAVLSGAYGEDLETYLLEQFPFRGAFRTLKAATRFFAFQQLDNDGIYLEDGNAFKMESKLDEKQVLYAADKICEVYDRYLEGMDVYYAMIPDKNVFADGESRPKLDYEHMKDLVRDQIRHNVSSLDTVGFKETTETAEDMVIEGPIESIDFVGMKEIDIWSELCLEDYYRTDPHWKQENIYPAAMKLAEGMGVADAMIPWENYTPHTLDGFYGSYYGQAALPLQADQLTYMVSDETDAATVSSLEFEGERPVYSTELFDGMDGYDVYLSGAQGLLTITCPEAKTDRELIVFRDSYGSAIVPYFIGAYSKITLVDLRYLPTAMVGDYVEFTDQDVLFLYSTLILNAGGQLK